MKKITNKKKSEILSKIDSEGLDYYLSQGYAEKDFKGTEHEKIVAQLAENLRAFELLVDGWDAE